MDRTAGARMRGRHVLSAFDSFLLDPSPRLLRMSAERRDVAPVDTLAESWITVGKALQHMARTVVSSRQR